MTYICCSLSLCPSLSLSLSLSLCVSLARVCGLCAYPDLSPSQVHQTVLLAMENQDYPFPVLVEHLKIPRDKSRPAVFQVPTLFIDLFAFLFVYCMCIFTLFVFVFVWNSICLSSNARTACPRFPISFSDMSVPSCVWALWSSNRCPCCRIQRSSI